MATRDPFLAGLFVLGLAACGGSSSTPPSGSAAPGTLPPGVTLDKASAPRSVPSATGLEKAVSSNNAFALSLYGQYAPTAIGPNVLTSPLSASLALSMTYAGAKGQTATEMASALQFQGEDAATVFDAENALSQAVAGRAAAALTQAQQLAKAAGGGAAAPSASDYVLDVVNSVWGEKGDTWSSSFLSVLDQSYGTGMYLVDFATNPDGARTAINGWVSSQTSDKINDLLPAGAVESSTQVVLVNAVHLKLPWQDPFYAANTSSAPFTRADGSTVSVSFMHQVIDARYAETAQAQVVSLPLAGELQVVLALPKNGLASLVSSLTPQTWTAMTAGGEASVTLSLPKLTFTSTSFSLRPALEALGMKTAFTGTADFSGMGTGLPLQVADVLQKATLDVAENGVEAAAATAVVVATSAAPGQEQQVTLTLDHPFLVSIVDASGAILFLGQIGDPTAAGGS